MRDQLRAQRNQADHQKFQADLQATQAKLEALRWIHDKVSTDEFRRSLRTIFSAQKWEIYGKSPPELSESISRVTCLYDLLGAGIEAGVFSKDAVLMTEWKILVPLWQRLEPLVAKEGTHRGIKEFKEHLKRLAEDARSFARQKGYDPDKLPWVMPSDILRYRNGPDGKPLPYLAYTGEHLHFFDVSHGSGQHWEYVSRAKSGGGVTIVAITGQHQVLLIEQYRPPLGKRSIEFPAGLVGDEPGAEAETVEEAVRRELKNETTLDCGKISRLANGSLLPGITDETNAFCLAEVEGLPGTISTSFELPLKGGNARENEVIPVIYAVPLDKVVPWLEQQKTEGKEIDLRIYAGLFLLKETGTANQKPPTEKP